VPADEPFATQQQHPHFAPRLLFVLS